MSDFGAIFCDGLYVSSWNGLGRVLLLLTGCRGVILQGTPIVGGENALFEWSGLQSGTVLFDFYRICFRILQVFVPRYSAPDRFPR